LFWIEISSLTFCVFYISVHKKLKKTIAIQKINVQHIKKFPCVHNRVFQLHAIFYSICIELPNGLFSPDSKLLGKTNSILQDLSLKWRLFLNVLKFYFKLITSDANSNSETQSKVFKRMFFSTMFCAFDLHYKISIKRLIKSIWDQKHSPIN